MESLYNIDARLKSILNDIEEAGGEITEEQIKELEITQEALKEKLNNYKRAYLTVQNDIDFAKKEKKRIDSYKSTKENIANRLKECMLEAVINYGETSKNGNKTIELDGGKLFTRNISSIEINNIYWDRLKDQVIKRLEELNNNGMLRAFDLNIDTNDIDIDSFINSINANYAAEYPEEAKAIEEQFGHLFTVDDLYCIKVNIKFNYTLADLLKKDAYDVVASALDNMDNLNKTNNVVIEDDIDKNYIKSYIAIGKNNVTIACIEQNQVLNIK